MTFKPPRHDDPPTLIFFRYGIAEVDSSIAQCHDVPGDQRPTSGNEWLQYWFHMRFTSTSLNLMAVLAVCPTANMLMCLKFQSNLLQNPGWLESPEWQHSRPPRITQYWMKVDGLLDPYENDVDLF